MSSKCFLEVYSKHTDLKDMNKVKYWDKYIELIEPKLSELRKNNKLDSLKDIIDELMPEFADCHYPQVYQSKKGNDYFVYNNQLFYKYFVPDTFLMPFKKGQEEVHYKEDSDCSEEQFSWGHIKYTTTVKEGVEVMEKRMCTLDESDFKTGCTEVLNFLKSMPLDSILILDSGDIYIEESPKYILDSILDAEEMFIRMDSK